MRNDNLKTKILLILTFIIFSTTFHYAIKARKDFQCEEYLQFISEKYSQAYNTIYTQYKQLADSLYSEIIKRYKIVERYEDLQTATQEEKFSIRNDLLKDISPRYLELKKLGIKQFHFHLSNNDSFLRVHKPGKYGDNLSNVRKTITYVNKKHMPIGSFEYGRIFDGYRFVFPITSPTKGHLGSMEISFSPASLTIAMMKQYMVLCNYFIKESNINKFVFKDEITNNYKKSHHKGYLLDKEVLKALEERTKKSIDMRMPSKETIAKVYKIAHSGRPMSVPDSYSQTIFTTVPIFSSIDNEMLAFVTVRSKDKYISQIEEDHQRLLVLLNILLALALLVFLLQSNRRRHIINCQESIKRNELQLKEAQELAKIGSWELDLKNNKAICSDEIFSIYEIIKVSDEISLDTFTEAIHPDDLNTVRAEFDNSIRSKLPFDNDHRLLMKDGRIKYVNAQCRFFYDDNGERVRAFGTIHDMTERKLIEHEMMSATKKFERMFKIHSAIMLIVDPMTGRIVDFNPAAVDFYGYTEEEMKELNIFDINTLPKSEIKTKMINALKGGEKSFIFSHIKKDKSLSYVEVYSTPFDTASNRYLFSIIHDITEKIQTQKSIKRYQEELEDINENLEERIQKETKERIEQEIMFKQMFNSLDNFVSVIDKNYNYIAVNKTYLRKFNKKTKDIVGKHVTTIIGQDLFENELVDHFKAVFKGKTVQFDGVLKDPKGVPIYMETTFTPYREVNGDISGVIVSASDVTEKILLEKNIAKKEQLMIQQSKLADMGSMIAAIAHQWKQPLNVIALSMGIYEQDHANEEDAAELSQTIHAQISFMSETINDFRNFYNPSKEKKSFNVSQSITKVLNLLMPKMKSQNIKVEVDADEKAAAYGYQNEFMQVLINLINNAKDAILENGDKEGLIKISIKKDEGNVQVSIQDNAGGIPPELLPEKLFEQFVTTKGDAGTGIGLSMSKTIIEQYMDGKLTAENCDSGAIFSVMVPSEDQSDFFAEKVDTSLLLVEDDVFTLNSMKNMLSKFYTKVYTAENGEEGLNVFRDMNEEISIVITDLDMPKVNGIEMSKEIRRLRPETPIIVTTAIAQDIFEDIGFSAIFEKPVSLKAICSRIQEILGKS